MNSRNTDKTSTGCCLVLEKTGTMYGRRGGLVFVWALSGLWGILVGSL